MTFEQLCSRTTGGCQVDTWNSLSNLPCVERILYCPAYNLREFQCKKLDFSCLGSIARTDFPTCVPSGSELVVIYRGTPNERMVEITTGCTCA